MVKVICRIKPPKRENTEITDDRNLRFYKKEDSLLDKNKIIYKNYTLDKFYDCNTSNYKIFYEQIFPITNESFYLFLYGHTGSGKTYTIFGNEYTDGIIDMLLKEFNYDANIEAMQLSSSGCIDVFNDKLVTLLEKENKINLHNLSHKNINNKEDYKNVIKTIKLKRKTGTSKYNDASSRTHLIINIYNDKKKYVIIDLAGNERKPNMKKGFSYIDTNYINSSLLSLKECFRRCNENSIYIPYRRSKLTRLLKNVFETKVKSIIISTIHSGFEYQNDTYDTLSYITQFKNSQSKYSIEKKSYDYNYKPYSKLLEPKKPVKLSKLTLNNQITKRPKSSPTSISLSKKEVFSSKKLEPLNINKYDSKYNNYLKKYKNEYKNEFKYKYTNDKPKYKKNLLNIKDVTKNNLINDYKDDIDDNYYNDYKIIDNTKNKVDQEYEDYLNKKYGLIHEKKLSKNSFKIMKAINHIIYSRSIKNYVKMVNNPDDESKLLEVLNGTIATIEIVLSELNKIYN